MPKRKKVVDASEDEAGVNEEQLRVKHTVLLNSSFFRWIQDQHANHRTEFWRNGLEEYLKYGKEIQAKYPVASDTQTTTQQISAAAAGVGATKQAATSKAQKANATLPFGQTASASNASASVPKESQSKSLFGVKTVLSQADASWGGRTSDADKSGPKPAQSVSFGPPASCWPQFSGFDSQSNASLSMPDPSSAKPAASAASSEPSGTNASSSALLPPLSLPAASTPSTSASIMAPFSLGKSEPSFSFSSPASPPVSSTPAASSSSQPSFAGFGQPVASSTAASSALGASQSASAPASSPGVWNFGSSQSQASSSAPASAASGPAPLFGSPLGTSDTQQAAKPEGGAAPGAKLLPELHSSTSPADAASTAPSSGSLFNFGSSQPGFGPSNFAFGASQAASGPSAPGSGSNAFAFGASQAASGSSAPSSSSSQFAPSSNAFAFSSSQPAFGSSQPAFGPSSAASGSSSSLFGSSLPAFGSPVPATSSSQAGTSGALPRFSFGPSQPATSAASQPISFGSAPSTGALPTFSWGAPASTSAAAAGSAPASGIFSFSLPPGQNGAGPTFGAPAAQANGGPDGEEQAEPEEAVVYEKTEGVLDSQEVKWAFLNNGKWGKFKQGKVLVCQPPEATKPYLQFQTSGYVVATAHAQTKLTQHSVDAKRVLGTLALSMRQLDKDSGEESFDKPESQTTMIVCKSSDAAKSIVEKMPDPKK